MSKPDAPFVLTIVEIGMHAFERDGEVEIKPYVLFNNCHKRVLGALLLWQLVAALGAAKNSDEYIGRQILVSPMLNPNGQYTVTFGPAPDETGPTPNSFGDASSPIGDDDIPF